MKTTPSTKVQDVPPEPSGTRGALRIYIDSVTEGIARLLVADDGTGEPDPGKLGYTLPAGLLPDGVGEGAWLDLKVTPQPEAPHPGNPRHRLIELDEGARTARAVFTDRDGSEHPYRLPAQAFSSPSAPGSAFAVTLQPVSARAAEQEATALRRELGKADDGKDFKL